MLYLLVAAAVWLSEYLYTTSDCEPLVSVIVYLPQNKLSATRGLTSNGSCLPGIQCVMLSHLVSHNWLIIDKFTEVDLLMLIIEKSIKNLVYS